MKRSPQLFVVLAIIGVCFLAFPVAEAFSTSEGNNDASINAPLDWEYKVLRNGDHTGITTEINNYARRGWELQNIVYVDPHFVAFIKKRD